MRRGLETIALGLMLAYSWHALGRVSAGSARATAQVTISIPESKEHPSPLAALDRPVEYGARPRADAWSLRDAGLTRDGLRGGLVQTQVPEI